jgi:hypothetical protein
MVNKIKETGQNIESKAWLVSKCILYEKETCILDVQDTILKASKWTSTLGVKSHGVSQIMSKSNVLWIIWKILMTITFGIIIIVLHSQSEHATGKLWEFERLEFDNEIINDMALNAYMTHPQTPW